MKRRFSLSIAVPTRHVQMEGECLSPSPLELSAPMSAPHDMLYDHTPSEEDLYANKLPKDSWHNHPDERCGNCGKRGGAGSMNTNGESMIYICDPCTDDMERDQPSTPAGYRADEEPMSQDITEEGLLPRSLFDEELDLADEPYTVGELFNMMMRRTNNPIQRMNVYLLVRDTIQNMLTEQSMQEPNYWLMSKAAIDALDDGEAVQAYLDTIRLKIMEFCPATERPMLTNIHRVVEHTYRSFV